MQRTPADGTAPAPSFCPIIARRDDLNRPVFRENGQVASANVQKTLYNCSAWWYNLHLMETSRSGGAYHERRDADISIPLPPVPSKTVMGTRSVFALEASNAEVECDCGGSALRVSFDGEKYRLYVPCGLCGGTHEAVCRPEQLRRGPALPWPAPGASSSPASSGRRRRSGGTWRSWSSWPPRRSCRRARDPRGLRRQRHHVRDPV